MSRRFRSVYDPGDSLLTARFPVVSADIADDAVTTGKIANDAVTSPKAATGVVDGDTITGAVIQTDTTGQRIVIDGPGDIINFYSGIAGEATPTVIDPTPSGSSPSLFIRSGTATGILEQAKILLHSGLTGSSVLLLEAGATGRGTILLNGCGSGAGMDSWQVACSSNANPTSTTNVTIAGLSQTITSPGSDAVYLVHIDADVTIATAGTLNLIELLVDGVAQSATLRTLLSGTGAVAGHKVWRITGLSAGSHTFTAQTRNSAGSTSAIVNAGVTLMTVERKA